jgi:pentose-5-phosphate-3-epimerase
VICDVKLMSNIQIGASFKSLRNVSDLSKLIAELENAGVGFIHLDFFDGEMVKSSGLTYEEARAIKGLTELPLEAHLLVYEPKEMEFYRNLGIDRVIVHHESHCDKRALLLDAKDNGMEAGIALKPSTSHEDPTIIYPDISDTVLVMATKSGSGGKDYDENAPERVRQIRRIYQGPILVNSGIITYLGRPDTESTTYQLSRAGATRFAIEKGLFGINTTIEEAVRLNIEVAERGKTL